MLKITLLTRSSSFRQLGFPAGDVVIDDKLYISGGLYHSSRRIVTRGRSLEAQQCQQNYYWYRGEVIQDMKSLIQEENIPVYTSIYI